MGTIITIVLAILILGYGVYALVTGIKREVKGEGCSGCSGCCHSDDCHPHDV